MIWKWWITRKFIFCSPFSLCCCYETCECCSERVSAAASKVSWQAGPSCLQPVFTTNSFSASSSSTLFRSSSLHANFQPYKITRAKFDSSCCQIIVHLKLHIFDDGLCPACSVLCWWSITWSRWQITDKSFNFYVQVSMEKICSEWKPFISRVTYNFHVHSVQKGIKHTKIWDL